jgi:hypothetical protein
LSRSQIFYTDKFQQIETAVVALLNAESDFLSPQFADSTRAVGDAIQKILSKKFRSVLGDSCTDYFDNFSRKAMADFAFRDSDNFYYAVDVKTHRLDTHFNMPNLISVNRLAQFYEVDTNYFVLLIVKYSLDALTLQVRRVHFVPIEFLSWDCLTIGALGWGQLQIVDANQITINPSPRKAWMLTLCAKLLEFYSNQTERINKRIAHFEQIKRHWLDKADA